MPHDYAAQRAQTRGVFADIQAENAAAGGALPDFADIDYAFLPGPNADWDGAMKALAQEGYACTRYAAEADQPADLVASLPDQALSATGIWLGEEVATRIALAHGFRPDGWGFAG